MENNQMFVRGGKSDPGIFTLRFQEIKRSELSKFTKELIAAGICIAFGVGLVILAIYQLRP
jgi:hypothetical protein